MRAMPQLCRYRCRILAPQAAQRSLSGGVASAAGLQLMVRSTLEFSIRTDNAMPSKTRIALACVCLALIAGLVIWSRSNDGESSAEASNSGFSHADCRKCHQAVWREWEQSYHAKAWTDSNVQTAFAHFGHDRKCHACHAPQPVLRVGLEQPVALRDDDHESGINCLTCHAGSEPGTVAARRTITDAPCRPVAQPSLSQSQFCGGCHKAVYDDWRVSRYVKEGKTCQTCHMPQAPGRAGGVSHVCLGGHDTPTVRGGVKMTCRREGDELVVDVTNHTTGHNFPGERHNRTLYLQVIERAADGKITLARQHLIKGVTPFRGESTAEKIKADETVTMRFEIVSPPVTADVRLLYKPFAWFTDHDALVVHREEMKLEER